MYGGVERADGADGSYRAGERRLDWYWWLCTCGGMKRGAGRRFRCRSGPPDSLPQGKRERGVRRGAGRAAEARAVG